MHLLSEIYEYNNFMPSLCQCDKEEADHYTPYRLVTHKICLIAPHNGLDGINPSTDTAYIPIRPSPA